MKTGVTIKANRLPEMRKAVTALTSKRVLVGIPEENAERNEGGDASNALIGYVLETGDPSRNLPARPFLVPGVAEVEQQSINRLRKAGEAALRGDATAVETALAAIGLSAEAAVKDKMDVGPFVPLSDATLQARIRAKKAGDAGASQELQNRRAGMAPSTELAQPLIDTGDLQAHVTYVIRDIRTRR